MIILVLSPTSASFVGFSASEQSFTLRRILRLLIKLEGHSETEFLTIYSESGLLCWKTANKSNAAVYCFMNLAVHVSNI